MMTRSAPISPSAMAARTESRRGSGSYWTMTDFLVEGTSGRLGCVDIGTFHRKVDTEKAPTREPWTQKEQCLLFDLYSVALTALVEVDL